MRFKQLTDLFQRLEATSSRLEMTSILSEFLSEVPAEKFPTVLLLVRGRVLPLNNPKEIGVGEKLVINALSKITGAKEIEIENKVKETGDLGLAAKEFLKNKTQTTLVQEELTVERVHGNLTRLADLSGEGTQEKKISYICDLLSMATPLEGEYIVRLVLEELRLGVGEGIIRDAVSSTFEVDPDLLERARALSSNMGEVAKIARLEGNAGLREVDIKTGRPIEVMLAQKMESIEDVFEEYDRAVFEIKYDGVRIQVHKKEENVFLFTRRLENVSKQFPEIVKAARENLDAETAVVEGELVAVKSLKDRTPRPFQDLSRRIKRKYQIQKMVNEIPVELNLFDLVQLEGKTLIDEPFAERREKLENIVKENDNFCLADHVLAENIEESNEFYEKAVEMGHEGVIVKNPEAPYQPGSRVGYMYKIKPAGETLDLVIVGALWGEGRRANWLSSFLLAVRDEETGELLKVGKMATGLTDEEFQEMTDLLEPLIQESKGKEVKVKPKIVIEVAYDTIQESPTYDSGYALRFPRLVRIREDKNVEEADTLNRLRSLYNK